MMSIIVFSTKADQHGLLLKWYEMAWMVSHKVSKPNSEGKKGWALMSRIRRPWTRLRFSIPVDVREHVQKHWQRPSKLEWFTGRPSSNTPLALSTWIQSKPSKPCEEAASTDVRATLPFCQSPGSEPEPVQRTLRRRSQTWRSESPPRVLVRYAFWNFVSAMKWKQSITWSPSSVQCGFMRIDHWPSLTDISSIVDPCWSIYLIRIWSADSASNIKMRLKKRLISPDLRHCTGFEIADRFSQSRHRLFGAHFSPAPAVSKGQGIHEMQMKSKEDRNVIKYR